MQSQQLLPKGKVLEEEFSSGAKGGDNPVEQMSEAHKHQVIIAKSAQRRCASKSLILQTCRVLARHRIFCRLAPWRTRRMGFLPCSNHSCRMA
jgi:hypothetical protein